MRPCLATASVTSAANTLFQRFKGMFHPRLTDLFEAFGVISTAAHTIKVLRHDGVIGIWQGEPIDRLVAVVTRVCSYGKTDLGSSASLLGHIFYISDNNIRARHKIWNCGPGFMLDRRHHHRFRFAVNKLVDLDRLHRRADRDGSGYRIGI